MKIEANKFDDIHNYKIQTYLISYQILERLISSGDNTISKKEIIHLLNTQDKDALSKRAIDKLVERNNERFKTIFSFSENEYYYDRSINKYCLSLGNISKLEPYKALYNLLYASVISHQLKTNNISKVFVTENAEIYKTAPSIFKLIEAIQNKKAVAFNHINLFTGEENYHEMDGWFIKQYKEKFYLIGLRTKKNETIKKEYRHFDISQIMDDSLVVLDKDIDENYKNNEFPNIEHQIFDQCIGVRISKEDNPNELCLKNDIIVETDFALGKSWLKNPIHKKQECIKIASQINEKYHFKFTSFYFNTTFRSLILSQIGKAKIIAPNEAIDEIKNDIKNL